MSERIDVAAAFDPELRQAQKDIDDYVNNRPESGIDTVDIIDNEGQYVDAIDREIAKDPVLRRMLTMADEIRTIGDTEVSIKDNKQLSRMYEDKMDKLTDLLAAYEESDSSPVIESKEDVMRRVIDRTSEGPIESEVESAAAEVSSGGPIDEDERSSAQDVVTDSIEQSDSGASDSALEVAEPSESEEPGHGSDAESAAESTHTPFTVAHREELNKKLSADDLEILDEKGAGQELTADDLEILDEGEERPAQARSRRERAADWVRHPFARASAEMTARAANRQYEQSQLTEQERDKKDRRRRLLGGFVLFGGALGAAGLLLAKNHFGGGSAGAGNSGGTFWQDILPPIDQIDIKDGGTGSTQSVIETVRVNHGDGEIMVTQNILDQLGIHVDVDTAQKIGEHAGVDLLVGDNNYDDTASTLNRIGAPGEYKLQPGAADALLKAARELGVQ